MSSSNLMREPSGPLQAKQTLLLILLPLLSTFVVLRLYLQLVRVRHVYQGGYLVHHLSIGILLVLPAAFLLAFGADNRRLGLFARVALGAGSAMILDEITYLIATRATDQDYVSRVSFLGAIFCISLAAIVLLTLYVKFRD